MRAAVFNGPRSIKVGERPDPVIQEPTDAVVRVVLACVCGSDLWYYRGESPHAVGLDRPRVHRRRRGHSAPTCTASPRRPGGRPVHLQRHVLPALPDTARPSPARAAAASATAPSTAARAKPCGSRSPVRTLVKVPGSGHSDELLRSLLTLSDVMATGHHAAVSGGVGKGDVVAVVGDGAVGLCAVLAAKRLGAERIIALSRHADRQQLARIFGATDSSRNEARTPPRAVLDLTGGIGVDAALECVGTEQSIATAFAIARPGSTVGIVGVPHGEVPFAPTFFRNVGWRGGPAPARIYIPELLDDVLDGAINPGLVLDYETDLDHIADAYAAMDERRAIKSLVRVGSL